MNEKDVTQSMLQWDEVIADCNNWKWNAKTKNKQTRKITRGTETIAKGWEINNFVEGLGYHVAADCRYLRIWDLLSFWYVPQS